MLLKIINQKTIKLGEGVLSGTPFLFLELFKIRKAVCSVFIVLMKWIVKNVLLKEL